MELMVRDMCASALLSEVCLSTVTNAKCADGNADLSVIGLWHTCVWCSMLGVTSVLDLFPYLEIGGSGGLRTPIAQSPSFERSPSQLTGNHLSDTLRSPLAPGGQIFQNLAAALGASRPALSNVHPPASHSVYTAGSLPGVPPFDGTVEDGTESGHLFR